MAIKKGKKKTKSSAAKSPLAGLMAKQRRQTTWRESLIFLFKNTSICTENYINFEKKHFQAFKQSLTGRENTLKDIALISNRIKFQEIPAKPAPSTLKEFKDNQPKKLTKKGRIKEMKNPSLKPLPKVTIETVFDQNEKTEAIDRYLDVIDRLKTLSKMAADFNKSIDKFPEELRGTGLGSVPNGLNIDGTTSTTPADYGLTQASTASDLENNGEKMIAYWHGLSGAKTFKVAECGSVGFSMPALLSLEEENEILKNKWAHLARTILRLAQNFVTYASRKTGIIINDSVMSVHNMRMGLSDKQIEIMDKLTKSILVTPVTEQSIQSTEHLLGDVNQSSGIGGIGGLASLDISKIGQPKLPKKKSPEQIAAENAAEIAKLKEEAEIRLIPGRSDENTLHLPDEPPKVGVAKKKKKGSKKYSISKK